MTDENPYERRIQLTGGTTYTVSLPKEWADDHGFGAGSSVNLHTRGDRLLVTHPSEDDRRRVTVPAARYDSGGIARLVTAAYVAGVAEVRVEGSLDRDARTAVREAITGLLGLQVATETDRAIVARTMLDAEAHSPEQTLVQMERITLSMHEQAVDAALAADGPAGRRVADQDDAVDRLFALITREFQRSLVDVRVAHTGDDLTPFDHFDVARQLERVADHAEKIGGVATQVPSPPPEGVAADLRALAGDTRDLVRRTLAETIGERDPDTLGAILVDVDGVVCDSEELVRDISEHNFEAGYPLSIILNSLTRTAEYAANIAETGLQAGLRDRDVDLGSTKTDPQSS